MFFSHFLPMILEPYFSYSLFYSVFTSSLSIAVSPTFLWPSVSLCTDIFQAPHSGCLDHSTLGLWLQYGVLPTGQLQGEVFPCGLDMACYLQIPLSWSLEVNWKLSLFPTLEFTFLLENWICLCNLSSIPLATLFTFSLNSLHHRILSLLRSSDFSSHSLCHLCGQVKARRSRD